MESNKSGPVKSSPNSPYLLAPQAIPAVVDQYRLLQPLGWGASGIVCEAADTAMGRRVAIKLIARGAISEASPPPTLREARLAGLVRHPNVVSLYDTGTYPGGIYLVMELVEGRSVQSLLSDGPLPWREATTILLAACEGVAAVHARGIIHCNITPDNLLRAADGTVKLADFGASRLLDPSKGLANSKRRSGPSHCESHEERPEDECDERTDIYLLGATYRTLLTGWTPGAVAYPQAIKVGRGSGLVADPRNDYGEIPRACADIVARAMAEKPRYRYASARAMQKALRGVLRRRPNA
jgi:serine/threonine protein kinase